MKIERIDLYDYKIVFSISEGSDIIEAAKEANHTPEEIVAEIIVLGQEMFNEV